MGRDVRTVVLDLSTSPNIDLSGARMLGQVQSELSKQGIAFGLAGVHGSVRDILQLEKLDVAIEGAAARMEVADLVRAHG